MGAQARSSTRGRLGSQRHGVRIWAGPLFRLVLRVASCKVVPLVRPGLAAATGLGGASGGKGVAP
jgi:hypothetical protein